MAYDFDKIDSEAAGMPYSDPLQKGVNAVLANCDNQPDPRGILESVLCYEPRQEIRNWFTSRGVIF